MRLTPPDISARKGQSKIVTLTAYTAPVAKLLDTHADILLVGDSLGMTIYGMENTLGVSLDMMIAHGRAVVRASMRAMVTVDLPFGSYQQNPAQAFAASAQVMTETGCAAVKLEGGAEMAETVRFLVERGIPVMGHVGLMPQHVNTMGGFKIQGRQEGAREKLLRDAKEIEAAGAFAIVIEGTREDIARAITESLAIPTIGIGASPACDGQVLVIDDVIGLTPKPPKFAKPFADAAKLIDSAATQFAKDVRSGAFPTMNECFPAKTNE